MAEPQELRDARNCLAEAEAHYRTEEGLARLGEGLALLDDVLVAGDARHGEIARNLAATYAGRLYERIKRLLDSDRAVPEPELEHFFKVVLAFDQIIGALPASARALKIEVARRLIERYYEGHPPEKKLEALRALGELEEN
jgi:hypothetical protein